MELFGAIEFNAFEGLEDGYYGRKTIKETKEMVFPLPKLPQTKFCKKAYIRGHRLGLAMKKLGEVHENPEEELRRYAVQIRKRVTRTR